MRHDKTNPFKPTASRRKLKESDFIDTKWMGAARRMGQLTDWQIAEFYALQARDGYAREAVEELCRTEKKTIEEITIIIKKYRKEEPKMSVKKYSDELKAAMVEDYSAGMTAREVAEKYGATESAVWNIASDARKKARGTSPEPVSAIVPTVKSNPAVVVGFWESAAEKLREVAVDMFCTGVKPVSKFSDESDGHAFVVVEDSDGTRYKVEMGVM